MIKKDINKSVFSFNTCLAVLVGLIFLTEPQLAYIKASILGSVSGKDNYINFLFTSLALGGYLIFTPLITALPCVTGFCEDYNSGFYKYILIRVSRKKYLFSRLVSNAVAGGITTAMPMLILFGLSIVLCVPYTKEHLKMGIYSPVHGTILEQLELPGGGVYFGVTIVLLSFAFGVVWSTIGLAVSSIITNRYVALCAPFVIFFAMHLFFSGIKLEVFSPVNTILPDILPSFGFLIVYQLTMLIISTFVFLIFAGRRLKFEL